MSGIKVSGKPFKLVRGLLKSRSLEQGKRITGDEPFKIAHCSGVAQPRHGTVS